jgi:NCS1 family nucleobase:cation symporter-1
MANTLPESAAINTQQLVGFIIYIAIFVPLMFVHPSKLQPILVVAFIGVAATIIGLFGWAVGSNGGAGTVIASSKIIDQAEGSFRMLQACSAVAGSWTGSSIRQSDWTRFAKTKRSPVLNQLIGAPATITIAAAFGVFATSAVKSKFGVTVWNPIELLQWILANQYTPAARAGCFFGGCGFFLSQLSVNLVQNSVSAGMDLASLAPKYIDTTRGALIMIVVGVVINPWRFVNTPSSFITVLSSFGMFVSPLAGVNVADL